MTIKDVLFEIFDKPTEDWPIKFRQWIIQITTDQFTNTHDYNVANTDREFRLFAKLALKQHCEWINEAGLLE